MSAFHLATGPQQTLRSLMVDQFLAEVAEALEAEGLEPAVVKGPAFVQWLYDDGGARPYGDGDLLVRVADLEPAAAVMRRLGFSQRLEGAAASPELPHDHAWRRGDEWIDLDCTLHGIRTTPERASEILLAGTEPCRVAGRVLRTLDEPRRALHVALHAAQHGRRSPKPLTDLRRALERCSRDTWAQAADLAEQLEAIDAFVAGLGLDPDGARLLTELGLSHRADVRAHVAAETEPYAVFFEDLAEGSAASGLRRIRREVFPSAEFLRWWSPLARRGTLGLIAVRLWRPIWLLGKAGPAFRAWWRARHREPGR